MLCVCRNCHQPYFEGKSTADYKGYCRQACLHAMAKSRGYSKARERKLGRTQSEYAILRRAGEIGSVPVQPKGTGSGQF